MQAVCSREPDRHGVGAVVPEEEHDVTDDIAWQLLDPGTRWILACEALWRECHICQGEPRMHLVQ